MAAAKSSRGCGEGRRVGWVAAGKHAQQDGGIGHAAGQRAGMVERPAMRHDAVAADAAKGRLEPDGAAEACRDADGAAGVGPHRRYAQPGHDRGARSAAGPAGDAGAVPRITHRRRRRAPGVFVRAGLADQDRARRAQLGRHRGVAHRKLGVRVAGAGGRRHVGSKIVVLDRDRNAMQRPRQPHPVRRLWRRLRGRRRGRYSCATPGRSVRSGPASLPSAPPATAFPRGAVA